MIQEIQKRYQTENPSSRLPSWNMYFAWYEYKVNYRKISLKGLLLLLQSVRVYLSSLKYNGEEDEIDSFYKTHAYKTLNALKTELARRPDIPKSKTERRKIRQSKAKLAGRNR